MFFLAFDGHKMCQLVQDSTECKTCGTDRPLLLHLLLAAVDDGSPVALGRTNTIGPSHFNIYRIKKDRKNYACLSEATGSDVAHRIQVIITMYVNVLG